MENKIPIPQSSPSYFSTIPGNVRKSRNLSAQEKLLYGDIASLCNTKGFCWATNEYLANIADVSENHVTKMLRNLEKEKFILTRHKKGTSLRQIFVSSELYYSIPGFDYTNLSKFDKELDQITLEGTAIRNDCGSDFETNRNPNGLRVQSEMITTSIRNDCGSNDDFGVDTLPNAPKKEPIYKDYNKIYNIINKPQPNKENKNIKTQTKPETQPNEVEEIILKNIDIPLSEFYALMDNAVELLNGFKEQNRLASDATLEEKQLMARVKTLLKTSGLIQYMEELLDKGLFAEISLGNKSDQMTFISTPLLAKLPNNTAELFRSSLKERGYAII